MEAYIEDQQKVSCVFADDNTVMRAAMRLQLEKIPWIEIVGEASDGQSTLELIRRMSPQLALIDHDMPQMTGKDISLHVDREGLGTRVVLYSSMTDVAVIREAFQEGLSGYILKGALAIEAALLNVHEGGTYIDPAVSDSIRPTTAVESA